MGMFDYVNFKMKCPRCKRDAGRFQTKDLDRTMKTVEYWECTNFYASCDYCHAWIEFTLRSGKKGKLKLSINDYYLMVEDNQIPEECFSRNSEGKIFAIRGRGYGNYKK